MATAKRDYYEVIEVTRTATSEEIKKAYRRLAVKYHPDKNPDDPAAEERFKELGEAYDVLMDDQKRAAYDRYGHAAFAQGGGAGAGFHDPFDLFREVFGGGRAAGGGGGGIFEQFFGGRPEARRNRASAAATCGTISRSASRRRPRAARRKSRSPSWMGAAIATGPARSRARRPRAAPPAAAAARSFPRADSFRSRRPAHAAAAPARSSKSRARNATARAGWKTPPASSSRFPPASRMARGSAPRGTARPASAAARPGTFTWSSTSRSTRFSSAKRTNLFCEIPIKFVTAALGGEVPRAHAGRGRLAQDSRRHARRHALQAARQRHAHARLRHARRPARARAWWRCRRSSMPSRRRSCRNLPRSWATTTPRCTRASSRRPKSFSNNALPPFPPPGHRRYLRLPHAPFLHSPRLLESRPPRPG